MNKTIVLANAITTQQNNYVTILYYNRDVKIYILNQDIMPDWFPQTT